MPILQHIFKKRQKKETGPKTQKKGLQEKKRQEQKEAQVQEQVKSTKPKKQQKQQPKDDLIKAKKDKSTKSTASTIKTEGAHGAYGIIIRPHISEKSVAKNNQGKYVFEVYPRANKNQIKNAIEVMYDVKVESINKTQGPS